MRRCKRHPREVYKDKKRQKKDKKTLFCSLYRLLEPRGITQKKLKRLHLPVGGTKREILYKMSQHNQKIVERSKAVQVFAEWYWENKHSLTEVEKTAAAWKCASMQSDVANAYCNQLIVMKMELDKVKAQLQEERAGRLQTPPHPRTFLVARRVSR